MEWKAQSQKESIRVDGRVLSGIPVLVEYQNTSFEWSWNRSLACFFAKEKKGETLLERSFPLRYSNCQYQADEGVYQVYFESTLQKGFCTVFEFELAYESMAFRAEAKKTSGSNVKSPITGTALAVHVENGQQVKKGQLLFVIEAMKMENKISAPVDGLLDVVGIKAQDKVQSGQLLVKILPG